MMLSIFRAEEVFKKIFVSVVDILIECFRKISLRSENHITAILFFLKLSQTKS